jgi:hypothetical protein
MCVLFGNIIPVRGDEIQRSELNENRGRENFATQTSSFASLNASALGEVNAAPCPKA